jgi:biopolymer transport protein ExbD
MSFTVRLLCVVGFVAVFGARLSQQGAGEAPVLTPPVVQSAAVPTAPEQIVLDYSADRRITINGEPVLLPTLRTRLQSLYRGRADRTLWVAGDGSLRYGEIADVIEAARAAGVERVGVITPEMRKGW